MLGYTKGALSGEELFRFQDEDADVRVLLDGLTVDEVIAAVSRQGVL
ncbi:hypothetical protein [Streptomyces sp. NPDC040750]